MFSATPDLGALVFLASSNLSLLGVAMASAFFLSALAMSRIQIWILLSCKGFSSSQIWGMLYSKVFVNALNFERVIFFQSFNNERSFALVSNAGFIESLSMHVYRILFFIEI